MKPKSVLYSSRAFLGSHDVARLVQASVYLADTIWIPHTALVDPSLPHDAKYGLERRLGELSEIGALRRWSIESHADTDAPSDNTIPLDVYRNLYDSVVDRVMANRVRFIGETAGRSFDGITEIVLGKQALWHFALRHHLGTDGLLYDRSSSANIGRFVTDLLGRMHHAEEVVQEIALRLNLPDVSEFGINEIVRCRQYMPTFRADLLARLQDESAFPGVTSESLIDRVVGAVVSEFFDYAHEAAARSIARRTAGRSTFLQSLWSVVQMAFNDALRSSLSEALFTWSPGTAVRVPPQMLLLEVKHRELSREHP